MALSHLPGLHGTSPKEPPLPLQWPSAPPSHLLCLITYPAYSQVPKSVLPSLPTNYNFKIHRRLFEEALPFNLLYSLLFGFRTFWGQPYTGTVQVPDRRGPPSPLSTITCTCNLPMPLGTLLGTLYTLSFRICIWLERPGMRRVIAESVVSLLRPCVSLSENPPSYQTVPWICHAMDRFPFHRRSLPGNCDLLTELRWLPWHLGVCDAQPVTSQQNVQEGSKGEQKRRAGDCRHQT